MSVVTVIIQTRNSFEIYRIGELRGGGLGAFYYRFAITQLIFQDFNRRIFILQDSLATYNPTPTKRDLKPLQVKGLAMGNFA